VTCSGSRPVASETVAGCLRPLLAILAVTPEAGSCAVATTAGGARDLQPVAIVKQPFDRHQVAREASA